MKRLLVFLLPLFALACLSCSDDPEGTPMGRFVYYVKGDLTGSAEFRRFDIESGRDELLSTDRYTVLSDVASNGRLLFETHGGTDAYQLFGQCEGGQVIPVPLPVAGDPAQTYAYVHLEESGTTFPPAMSYGGHHAAFFAWQRPVAYRDSSAWKLHLCVFDCSAWKMRTLDLASVLQPYFEQRSMMMEEKPPTPGSVAISDDGSIVATSLTLRVRVNGGEAEWRRIFLGGTLDRMLVLPVDSLANALNPAFHGATGTLYFSTGQGTGVAFDCRGGLRQGPFATLPMDRLALSAVSGEVAMHPYSYGTQTFILRRASDGRDTHTPLSRETLLASFPDTQWLVGSIEHSVSISPDGEWLAFRTTKYEEHRALYIVRRDGTGLRRIAEGTFVVAPVVSDLVPY